MATARKGERMRLITVLRAAGAVLLLAVAPASAEVWRIDPDHTQLTFRVNHLGYSFVTGMFREMEADIDFDPDAVEDAKVEFRIKADSLDTNSSQRDGHLKGPHFLDVENHPEIVFTTSEVILTTGETAEVRGDLTIRGVTREEVFEVRLNRIGPSPLMGGITVGGFTVAGVIDRTRYGMDFGVPGIGAEVELRLDLEASPR